MPGAPVPSHVPHSVLSLSSGSFSLEHLESFGTQGPSSPKHSIKRLFKTKDLPIWVWRLMPVILSLAGQGRERSWIQGQPAWAVQLVPLSNKKQGLGR